MVSLANVLERKYGPVASTKQKNPDDKSTNPEMVISSWNHPEIEKPTKAQLVIDFQEYEIYIVALQTKKQAIVDDLKILKELNKNKSKDDITDKDVINYYKLKMMTELLFES